MNSTLDQHVIEAAYAADPEAAASEYGASFRSDLSGLFELEALQACVISGRRELLPQQGILQRFR